MEKEEITVVIPSYRNLDLLENSVSSFYDSANNKFKIHCIIVENDGVPKTDSFNRFDTLEWILHKTSLNGSEANGEAIITGLEMVKTPWVFFAHNDVFVAGKQFYDSLYIKIKDGYRVIGVCRDEIRIKALHISGILAHMDLFSCNGIDLMPKYDRGIQVMDVGDDITRFCIKNGVRYFCFDNTYNDHTLIEKVPEPFKNITSDRCMDGPHLIYVHLGRGTARVKGQYTKSNRATLNEWLEVCKNGRSKH